MRDLMSNIHSVRVISPLVITDNTASVGSIIDRQGYDGLTYVIATGTLSDVDATVAVTIDHGDDSGLSDAAAVPAAQLIGTTTLASFNFADDNETRKIGYIGTKRYSRLTITPSVNTGTIPLSAVAILSHPNGAPTANPPQ